MDEILHHFETMGEAIVCWYLQGDQIIPGFRTPGPTPRHLHSAKDITQSAAAAWVCSSCRTFGAGTADAPGRSRMSSPSGAGCPCGWVDVVTFWRFPVGVRVAVSGHTLDFQTLGVEMRL